MDHFALTLFCQAEYSESYSLMLIECLVVECNRKGNPSFLLLSGHMQSSGAVKEGPGTVTPFFSVWIKALALGRKGERAARGESCFFII